MGFESLIQRLGDRELILPYFENAILDDKWPLSYSVQIDSGPYYGAGDGYFHPSTHPMLDEAVLYYMFHPEHRDHVIGERNTLARQMTLAMGSALHGVLQTQMTMAGLIADESDIEVEYVNHKHHVRGRMDWIATLPDGSRRVVEMKTRNVFQFSKQKEPEESWRRQLNLALDAAQARDSSVSDEGVLLMVQSGFPYGLKEFRVRRDPEVLDVVYEKFDRVRKAIADNEPPSRCCDLTKMKSCPARAVCPLAAAVVGGVTQLPLLGGDL